MFLKNKGPVIFTNDYKQIKANLAVKMKDGLSIKRSGFSGNRFVSGSLIAMPGKNGELYFCSMKLKYFILILFFELAVSYKFIQRDRRGRIL